MKGTGGRPVLLLVAMSHLLLLGSVVGQEMTSLPSPANTTSATTATPPQQIGNWTLAEDGALEISNFSGDAIAKADLEEGRQLRIINSSIGELPRDTFLVYPNITDATLEVVNTTIGTWNASILESFRAVTVTDSVIRHLGSGAIRLRSASVKPCSDQGTPRIVITFSGTTIEWLETGALALDAGSTLLRLTDCKLGGLAGDALQLSLVTQLHVQDTAIGALGVSSLCRVCSAQVLFERNRLLHVPPHALHFGSSRCAPAGGRDFACREVYAGRRVTISGTRLPCAPLGWLRDALDSCGSLSEHVSGDYRQLGETSHCSERNESVTSFLSREPEPEPEPEPAGGWCHSVGVAAGTAVALAVGFLALGLLLGWYWCRAPGGAARLFGRADSRHMQPDEPVISLPLQNKTKDDADGQNRSTNGRYAACPVSSSPKSRPPASTPQQQQQSRLEVPQPQPEARQPSPRPARADQQRPRREQRRRRPPAGPPAADTLNANQGAGAAGASKPPAADPLYANQGPGAAGASKPPAADPLYANQGPEATAASGDSEPIYENQQWQQSQPAEIHLYGNLHNI